MVTINVETGKATAFLNRAGKQVAYAASLALNRTGEEANAAIRARMQTSFTIRNPQMLRWVAPVTIPSALRATKQNLRVVLGTEGKGAILDPYQVGEPKTIDRLGRLVPVPSSALRPTKAAIIPRQLFPHNLGLQVRADPQGRAYYALGRNSIKRGITPFRGKAKQGKLGTFEIMGPRGNPLIYQRMGPGKGNIRLLWHLHPVVRRPPILGFYETASATFDARWPINFSAMFDLAMRTAR